MDSDIVSVSPPEPKDMLLGCACAVIFTFLLALDAWKAIKRKAYWFPGRFLVLSAFTIQFITYVNYSTVKLTSEDGDGDEDDGLDQLVIDSGRVAVCVFMAYLLPGLVSSGFRSVWTDVGALALSALVHMLSEIYVFDYDREVWVSDSILFTANIILLLLSICTVLAGKTIRIIVNRKVHALLSCCSNSSGTGCTGNIGDHVLKCWIVVRCSQPEYIIARSVLTSLAGLLVTVCFTLMVVECGLYSSDLDESILEIFVIQSAFVLIGWIAVAIRWLSAVVYFPRYGLCSFQMEDFWTRSLIELKYSQLNGPLWEKKDRDRTLLETKIVDLIVALRLHTLVLSIGLLVQKFVVLLSKASCFISSLLFWPLLMGCKKIMLLSGSNISQSEFSKYSQVLESITMPGENAESLWLANESAFKSTKKHLEQGMHSTKALIERITRLLEKETQQTEEKYFKSVSNKSSKMRAVSLIHFMLCFYDDTNSEVVKVVDDAFEACSEAWALMDFVNESSDMEANLVSLAADKEFKALENIWNKKLKVKSTQSDEKLADFKKQRQTDIESRMKDGIQSDEKLADFKKQMQTDIESRIHKGKTKERVENMHDFMDWITAAADFSLNETSEAIDLLAIDLCSANAIQNLGCLLAKVIVNCLGVELNNALIQKCSEWAADGAEEKIYHAVFLAGKAMSLALLCKKNNSVPPGAVAEGEGNNASQREDVSGSPSNDSSGTELVPAAV